MPQKVIRFKGINRKINEFQTSGECDELINLRPEDGSGLRVVKPKKVVMPDVIYDQVYEHSFGDKKNYVFVINGGLNWSESLDSYLYFLSGKFSGKKVSISSAGNVLVIYCEEDRSQLVYKFEDNTYKPYSDIPNSITSISSSLSGEARKTVVAEEDSIAAVNTALASAASGFYSNNPNGLCGSVIVGCAYELEDGNEVWATGFKVIDFGEEPTYSTDGKKVTVFGRKTTKVTFTFDNAEPKNYKHINVYATRPVYRYEFEEKTVSGGGSSGSTITIFAAKRLTAEECGLDGQIMYYQGKVIPGNKKPSITLDFRISQAGERIMDVSTGCVKRIGESVSYNNRFHYFKTDVHHVIQSPTMSNVGTTLDDSWAGYVKFNNEWKLLKGTFVIKSDKVNNFIYPMSGIEQLAFVKLNVESVEIETRANYDRVPTLTYEYTLNRETQMFYVDLSDSSAYNYSFAFDHTPELESAELFYDDMEVAGQLFGTNEPETEVLLRSESNTVNVSAPYNPFVFPVRYSYGFGGEVIDIATSYVPISSTQVGQYPLTVFTKGGIFSLEQGSGEVLYGNITPLQPIVAEGKVTATPYGAFFVSSGCLYLLSGRELADVSYILNGRTESNIKDTDAYRTLYRNNASVLYDFSDYLSVDEFKEFARDAVIVYDQLNNEILISSSDASVKYSYVINLGSKMCHKVTARYNRAYNGSRYVIEETGSVRQIVDLHVELDGTRPILLQSRPMSLEVLYTHIQRLVLHTDADLVESGNNMSLSVFASDHLDRWRCIISSQKQGASLRHIRTNRAAKSYKDYAFVISGTVGTDTDISELIADYTVVNRRLG